MALARVGAAAGPDLGGIAAARALGAGKRVYAAGGVRGPEDLRALRGCGAAGVLVASAIHAWVASSGRTGGYQGRLADGTKGGTASTVHLRTYRPRKIEASRWSRPRGAGGGSLCPGLPPFYALAAKGCWAELRCSVTVAAFGSPFTARSIVESLVASEFIAAASQCMNTPTRMYRSSASSAGMMPSGHS